MPRQEAKPIAKDPEPPALNAEPGTASETDHICIKAVFLETGKPQQNKTNSSVCS